MLKDYKNKKVGILGLGIEGISSAKYLLDQGAIITFLDHKKEEELDAAVVSIAKKLGVTDFILGNDYLDTLQEFNLLVRSPGIKRFQPKLEEVAAKGVVITSHIQLFFE